MLNKDKTIHIVTACDDAYVQHTAVFLKSLFENNPNNCRVFILVPDNFTQRASLERNLSSYRASLEFLYIDLSETSSITISDRDRVSVATYFRFFLDKLMPTSINRVIYLDSDILIAGPLKELWDTDLEENVIAAVCDAYANTDQAVRKKVELAPTSKYFNAGVLLIDLSLWRNTKLGERALAFSVEHPERLTWWDQCALNHILNGQFKELTKDWNFQTYHLRWSKRGKCTEDSLREIRAAKVIHFTDQAKPWYYLADHPMKSLYWKILRTTEWRNYHPPDRTGRNILRRILENRAPALLNATRRVRKFVAIRG